MNQASDTRSCPLCGETIKRIAVRCKHCHGTIEPEAPEPEFDRGVGRAGGHSVRREAGPSNDGGSAEPGDALVALADHAFEQRFLEFAYQTKLPLRAPAVAYGLRISIAEAEAGLEDLAVRDVLLREVDEEGCVYYRLPGGRTRASAEQAVVPYEPPAHAITVAPTPHAMAGLLLNLLFPGLGSLVAGKTWEGISQLVLISIGVPLSFIVIGIPICVAAWGWALSTGIRAVNESIQATPDAP
jgi:TM2 domain-containing membrane protein YozV